MALIAPLFSGSSGNSYFIGSKQKGILLDAGRSTKQILPVSYTHLTLPTILRV